MSAAVSWLLLATVGTLLVLCYRRIEGAVDHAVDRVVDGILGEPLVPRPARIAERPDLAPVIRLPLERRQPVATRPRGAS